MTGADEQLSSAPPTGTETGRAAGDSMWLVGSRIVVAGFGWVCSIITARSLDAVAWGEFSFVFALLGLMAIVTDLGVGRAVLGRLMTGDQARLGELATAFIALRVLLGVLGYGVAVGYTVLTAQDPHVVWATVVAGAVILLATPSHAMVVLYQSRLRMRRVAIGDILSQFAQLAVVVLVALMGGDLLWFVVPAVVNEIVNICWRARGIARGELGFRPRPPVRPALWGEMLRESVPLTIGFALTLLLTKVDMLMLERLDGAVAVGEYAVAYKFADVLSLAAITAMQPVTTLLVAAWPDDPRVFRSRFAEATSVLSLVAGLGVVVFVPVAGPVVTLLYGGQFGPSVTPSRILFVAAAGTALTQLAIQTLIAADHKKVFPTLAACGLLLNVLLNLYAIPRWSTLGSAVATVITELVMVVAFWIAVHRSLGWPVVTGAGRPVAVALVTAAVTVPAVLVVDRLPVWAWPLVLVVVTTLYVVLVVVLRLADPRIVGALASRLGRRAR